MNYLDRNEFNYAPSQEVVEALKNFDINNSVSIPVSTTKARRAFCPFICPRLTESMSRRCCWVMVEKIY